MVAMITATPSRIRSVTDDRWLRNVTGSSVGVEPTSCSPTQRLWYPSSSAREAYERVMPKSTSPLGNVCGTPIASGIGKGET